MTQQALKEHLHQAIDAETSTVILEQVNLLLNQGIPLVPPGVEARIAKSMADVATGRVYSHQEYLEMSAVEREKRRAKYASK